MQRGLRNWLGFNKPRDAPKLSDIQDNVWYSGNLFVFGMTHSGERVDERTVMQIITVYVCVRLLSNTIAGLQLNLHICATINSLCPRFAPLLAKSLITKAEYVKIDTMIAQKYGVSSCSIFR